MEFFAYGLAVAIPGIISAVMLLVSPALIMVIMSVAPPVLYIYLWLKLIKTKQDSIKDLLRFVAEWSAGGIYVATCIIANPIVRLPEDTIFATIWYWANLPLTMMASVSPSGDFFFPKTYIVLCAIMVYICAKPIIKNYKLTKKLW